MRVLKLILTYGPITAFVAIVTYTCVDLSGVKKQLHDPETVVWGQGESRINFSVEETSDGEISTHLIKALAADDRVVFEESWDVNYDMFGGGFVRGAQLDDDDDLEILAWGAHEADRAYFLDHSEGTVVLRPFSEASTTAQALPGQWRQAHTGNGLTLVLLGGLVFIYYVAYSIVRRTVLRTAPYCER